MTNGWIDIKNTDMMLIMGGNPAEKPPVWFQVASRSQEDSHAKMTRRRSRFSRTAAVADSFCKYRAGADIAFLGGLIKPHGWFSAGLPPMINIMSVFLMSIQPLVIAPRPKCGPQTGDRWTVSNSACVRK